uniref:Uncharacterized protein n=1 Tax=Tanacetum cinerariifolium TaxID=118510 RepID=A0A6L2KPV8_TANCI|nr:hypothetical protein [Tanacetum cinerariifolium]
MERGFLSQKGSGKGRGVKEKDTNGSNIEVVKDGTLNEVTPVFSLMEGVTPSVVDMDVEKDKLSSLEDTTVLGSFPPLLTQQLNENLLKEDVSTVPVWVKLHGVPVMAFSDDGLSAIATKLGSPLMLDSYTSDMCMQSWGRGDGHCTCNVRVEYEWNPPRCASCKVFGHIHEECPKNTGAGEKKTLKKPSQTS